MAIYAERGEIQDEFKIKPRYNNNDRRLGVSCGAKGDSLLRFEKGISADAEITSKSDICAGLAVVDCAACSV